MVSLAEVILYGADGEPLPVVQALNPGGIAPFDRQQASAVVDGWNASKWLDQNFFNVSRLTLVLAAAQQVVQYDLVTSPGDNNANRQRDPTAWDFGILRADNTFEVLSTVSGVTPPFARIARYGRCASHSQFESNVRKSGRLLLTITYKK